MTRKKKTRKPGSASPALSKSSPKSTVLAKDKKPKKLTGKTPGNRQQEAIKRKIATGNTQVKDPRLGSKKPIELVKAAPTATKPKKTVRSAPIAAVRVVASEENLAQQLAELEQDERLLDIIARQEQELELSAQDVDYFNDMMDRHQLLREKLGLDDEDDDAADAGVLSEDELWDKFNNNDFSDY